MATGKAVILMLIFGVAHGGLIQTQHGSGATSTQNFVSHHFGGQYYQQANQPNFGGQISNVNLVADGLSGLSQGAGSGIALAQGVSIGHQFVGADQGIENGIGHYVSQGIIDNGIAGQGFEGNAALNVGGILEGSALQGIEAAGIVGQQGLQNIGGHGTGSISTLQNIGGYASNDVSNVAGGIGSAFGGQNGGLFRPYPAAVPASTYGLPSH